MVSGYDNRFKHSEDRSRGRNFLFLGGMGGEIPRGSAKLSGKLNFGSKKLGIVSFQCGNRNCDHFWLGEGDCVVYGPLVRG